MDLRQDRKPIFLRKNSISRPGLDMSNKSLSTMKIAILGTRGIPNQYGGFEQFAEYLSIGLHERGHEVAVYLPHFHPYTEKTFKGVKLHRVYSPEQYIGAAANFVYDFFCLRDAVRRGYDIALECGYGTASISYGLLPLRKTRIITNMDGLEWKRAKWSPFVQRLTLWFEALAVKHSHALVADNLGIQAHFRDTYKIDSTYIPYGADLVEPPPADLLTPYLVEVGQYDLAIARLEPENNLELLIEGYRLAQPNRPLLVVGNCQTPYGRYLQNLSQALPGVRFLGGIYQKDIIDALRHYARIYFHGHSVGGTNPSLLEAMACGALIAAHDNPFNRSVTKDNALYFRNAEDVRDLMVLDSDPLRNDFAAGNVSTIRQSFSWNQVVEKYEKLALSTMIEHRH